MLRDTIGRLRAIALEAGTPAAVSAYWMAVADQGARDEQGMAERRFRARGDGFLRKPALRMRKRKARAKRYSSMVTMRKPTCPN